MCGINGIYAYRSSAPAIDPAELKATRDHMAARGPDGQGAWISANQRLGFGHRRLSIIDLSARAAQPMLSADGTLAITFNGEIYNHHALRQRLEARGCRFRTTSDTEVLLQLYAEHGDGMLEQLRGMFAFALWDAPRRRLLLARDPYGIKPLYIADDGRTLRFASQVKALLAGGGIPTQADPAGEAGFYLFGSVPEPFTCYRAIRALPAGCTLAIEGEWSSAPQPYARLAEAFCGSEWNYCKPRAPRSATPTRTCPSSCACANTTSTWHPSRSRRRPWPPPTACCSPPTTTASTTT